MSESIDNIIIEYSNGRKERMKKSLCIDLSGEKAVDMLCFNIDFEDLKTAITALRYALDKVVEEEGEEKDHGAGEKDNGAL